MSITLLLVLVVVFSFAVGHLLTRYASAVVTLSGAEYILVGVLIGPYFPWQLLDETALAALTPLVSLLLGLVGFVIGIRGERPPSPGSTVVGYVSSFLVLVSVAALLLPLLQFIHPVDEAREHFVIHWVVARYGDWVVELHVASTHLWVALGLGATACVASPLLVEATHRISGATGRVSELLTASAHASQVLAVLVLGLVLATAPATEAMARLSMTVSEWAMATAALGVVCGLLFRLFVGRDTDPARIFLATIGLVTFASGVGAALGVSPLFVTMLAGVTVSMTWRHSEAVRKDLNRLQHPLFVLVLIFAGTLWEPVHGWAWLLPACYVVSRFVARRFWTAASVRLLMDPPLRTQRIGNGLLSQGTLAAAVAVNFAQLFTEFAPIVLTTVLLGTLLSDLLSGRALRAVLADAGELGDPAPDPVAGASEAPS